MAKHTILIGGDDGKIYRISNDELKNYEVSAEEPHIGKLRTQFDSGLTHLIDQPDVTPPGEEPPNCFAATQAGEFVHFVNLSPSGTPKKD